MKKNFASKDENSMVSEIAAALRGTLDAPVFEGVLPETPDVCAALVSLGEGPPPEGGRLRVLVRGAAGDAGAPTRLALALDAALMAEGGALGGLLLRRENAGRALGEDGRGRFLAGSVYRVFRAPQARLTVLGEETTPIGGLLALEAHTETETEEAAWEGAFASAPMALRARLRLALAALPLPGDAGQRALLAAAETGGMLTLRWTDEAGSAVTLQALVLRQSLLASERRWTLLAVGEGNEKAS